MVKLIDILNEILLEEKKKADRCKRIADRKFDKPSAYKSGAIVRCRKGKIWKDLKEASTPAEVKDFLVDFSTLISLNFSQITKMGKDENATKELTLMMQQLRKPIINGKNYFDFLKDNINNIPSNPKLLSSILGIIRGFLIYIEPRIEQFVTDKPAPNGINYKEEWLKRINNIKNSYKKIVTEELTEAQKETLRTWFKRKGAPGKTGGWVDCNTCRNGKCKPCGRQKGEKRAKYPSCRPTPAQCKTPGKGKKWGKTK
jgi:hypothetical protein